MKGKTEFTEFEANQIRKLINQKLNASKSEQKTIRNKIRSFDFYFSDFSSKKGYTIQDFVAILVRFVPPISEWFVPVISVQTVPPGS